MQYDALSDLPKGTVDLLLLCVPHDLHESLCEQALACEVTAVVIEKPLAPSVAGCLRLIELAKARKKLLFVAENSAYWPEVNHALQLIQDGTIGDVVSIQAHYYESLVDTPFGGSENARGHLGWRASLSRCGGGVVVDGGLHWLRPLRMLGGRISSVVSSVARPFEHVEGESLLHALVKFRDSQVRAAYKCTVLPFCRMSTEEPWFRIIGTRGEITLAAKFEGGMRVYSDAHPSGQTVVLDPAGFLGSFEVQWEDIVQCVRRGQQSSVSPVAEAAADLACVEALYRSAMTGKWEPVSHDDDDCTHVPPEQLAFMDSAHGQRAVVHGGRGTGDLRAHLLGVRRFMLERFGERDPSLLAAALFHSVYGTEGFQGVVLPVSRRHDLQNLIGTRAERTAYLNCVMCRATLDRTVAAYRDGARTGLRIESRAELGAQAYELTELQLLDLMKVHLADLLQQVAAYSLWSYRRREYAAIAATLGGKFAHVYAEVMAEEPADAAHELPEMVRARQEGIFEQVQSGEISYKQLLTGQTKSKL